jgi:hypothetical protein
VTPDDIDLTSEPVLVRPYALVRGRTRRGSAAPLPVESVIVTDAQSDLSVLQLEPAAIVELCESPLSVAEVSARLDVPVGVVRVLVADLAADGHVHVNLPLDARTGDSVDRGLLERVLAGLEAL